MVTRRTSPPPPPPTSGGDDSLSARAVPSPSPFRAPHRSTAFYAALPLYVHLWPSVGFPHPYNPHPPRLIPISYVCPLLRAFNPPPHARPLARRRPAVHVPRAGVGAHPGRCHVSYAVRETRAKLTKHINRLVGGRMSLASIAKVKVLLDLVEHFAIYNPTINFRLHMSGYDLGGKVFWVPIFEDQVVLDSPEKRVMNMVYRYI